jgi:hypothetical protein
VDDDGSVFEGDIDRLGTAGVTRGCNPPTTTDSVRLTRDQRTDGDLPAPSVRGVARGEFLP